MTHFKIDIQLPLKFNEEDGCCDISPELFHETYEELLNLAGGINTSNTHIMGSWINPSSKIRYNDKMIVFTILVESEDRVNVKNVEKIKELITYKEKLKVRFKQHELFMVATRCVWL